MRGVDILKCLLQLMHDASDANHFFEGWKTQGFQTSAALGHVGLGWVKLAWIEVGVLWFDWIGVGLDSIDLHGIRAWCKYWKPFSGPTTYGCMNG